MLLYGILLILAGCAGKQPVTDYDEAVSVYFSQGILDRQTKGEMYKSKFDEQGAFYYNETFDMENYILKEGSSENLYSSLICKASLYGRAISFSGMGYDGVNIAGFAFGTGTNNVAVKYGEGGLYGGKLMFIKAKVYVLCAPEPEEFRDIEAVNVGIDLPMRDCDGEWSPFFIDKMRNMDIEFLRQIVVSELKRQFGTKFPEDCKGKIYFLTAPAQSLKDGFFNYGVRVKVKFE